MIHPPSFHYSAKSYIIFMPLMKKGYSWDQFNVQEASKCKNMQKEWQHS